MKKVIIVLLLLIVIGALGGLLFLNTVGDAKDPESTETISVEIPEGTYASQIGEILEEKGVISSALKWKIYLRLNKQENDMKAGN